MPGEKQTLNSTVLLSVSRWVPIGTAAKQAEFPNSPNARNRPLDTGSGEEYVTSGETYAPDTGSKLVGAGASRSHRRAVRLVDVFRSGITLVTLVLLFGAYALIDGVLNIIAFVRVAWHHWALLIEGVIGIIAGVLTFAWPAITALVLLYVIAFWAILTGSSVITPKPARHDHLKTGQPKGSGQPLCSAV